jgi:hypothetical protein
MNFSWHWHSTGADSVLYTRYFQLQSRVWLIVIDSPT